MFSKLFGPSEAEVKELADQMTRLNAYIAKNKVQIVENDPNNNFVKCDFEKEYRSYTSRDSTNKKAEEELLRKEYFLKVDKDKFVSIGRANRLGFDEVHLASMFEFVADGSEKYEKKIKQFMKNRLFVRNATGANPEETNTLIKAFLDAATQKRAERVAKETEKYQNQRHPNERISPWEIEHAEWINPEKCKINFARYLNASVDAITGIDPQHKGKRKTIYEFLLESLGSFGSTEGGFAKRFHNPTTMSGLSIEARQQMAKDAVQQSFKQGFIDKLCTTNGDALEIMGTAHRTDIGGGQSHYQTSQGEDVYSFNAWKALRMCLEHLENYILNHLNHSNDMLFKPPQFARLPAYAPHDNPTSAPHDNLPSAPNIYPQASAPALDSIGGKSKSRSKSIRKKRNSHRQKKSHSHKRRAPKRLAVN